MSGDVIVHLTGSDEDETRIDHAAMIARRLDAHLTGLYAHALPQLLSITDPTGSAFLQGLIEESIARSLSNTERLRHRLAELGLRQELVRFDLYPNEIADVLASSARMCDIFVGTRPYGDPARTGYLEEGVLFGSGRACLFVPPRHAAPVAYDTVLVAWKNTREAAHALAEALPFLQQAARVVIGVVEEGSAAEAMRGDATDIAKHLSRHDVSAEVNVIAAGSDPADALLTEARRVGADLVVIGAYGHSRLREWVAGGVTRRFLSECPVPVLTAH